MIMSRPEEDRDAAIEDRLEVPPPPAVPARNRRASRCYNVTMIVVYFVLLIVAVVALGLFGKKQADIIQYIQGRVRNTDDTCILFTTVETSPGDNVQRIYFHSAGLCGYVLWGLVSVTIVIFIWIVYSIVLAAIGPKVISVLRVLDLFVIALTFLLSLSLSITIHSGLDALCRSAQSFNLDCRVTKNGFVEFYDEINAAKVSSWITTVLLLGLSVWYAILMMIYCYIGSQRRKQAQQYSQFDRQDKELPAHV